MNKTELIIALQDAAKRQGGDLSRLNVDTEFRWQGLKYSINARGYRCSEGLLCSNEATLIKMLQTASTIEILPQYTPAEAERAKKDMECSAGFKWVSKDGTSITMLWTDEPEIAHVNGEFSLGGHGVWSRCDYPSLKPGTKERLEVIAGCGE